MKEKNTTILLGEMTRDEAKERIKECDVAILPVGSLEQHGPHLPLDTDAFDAYWLAQKVAKKVAPPRPVVCPPINYGVSYHHMDFAGTLTIEPATLSNLTYEIGISLVKHGIRKILIINGHGGNTPALNCTAQRLNDETNILVCVESGNITAKEQKRLFKTKNDVHSGEYETSTSLANREELVRKDRIRKPEMKFLSRHLEFEGKNVVPFKYRVKDISKTGVLGDPTKANKKKGEKIWNLTIDALVKVVEDLKKIKVRMREFRGHQMG